MTVQLTPRVKVWDGTRTAEVDPADYLVTIDTLHHKVHESELFSAHNYFSGVANNGNADILIKVPASYNAHMEFDAKMLGAFNIYLYETPTLNTDGTAITRFSRNRNTADNTSQCTTFHSPNVAAVGTEIGRDYNPSSTVASARIGGTATSRYEFILKASTNYLLRLTNVSGASQDVLSKLFWYEVGV